MAYFISTSLPMLCPGIPFSKTALNTPLLPCALAILPEIELPLSVKKTTCLPTSFEAFSLLSTPSATNSIWLFVCVCFPPLKCAIFAFMVPRKACLFKNIADLCPLLSAVDVQIILISMFCKITYISFCAEK